jgi:cyclic pyranopterin phosphate synthase
MMVRPAQVLPAVGNPKPEGSLSVSVERENLLIGPPAGGAQHQTASSVSAQPEGLLIDRWGRVHTDLRISVTDRCNLRCFYCMPADGVPLLPREALLDFDEIVRIVQVAVRLGIQKVRLTGGEPLLRKGLPSLIRQLANLAGLEDLAMTTNGTLLALYAQELREAGLKRINISLDTLDRRQFQALTGQDALPEVLQGIEAARRAGFDPIKLNALAIRGFSESQIIPLVRFAVERHLEIRFIEFMPIGPTGRWSPERVLPAEAILGILRQEFGCVEPIDPSASSGGEPSQALAGSEPEEQRLSGAEGPVPPGPTAGGSTGPGEGLPTAPAGDGPSGRSVSELPAEPGAALPKAATARPPARQYLLGRTGAQVGIIASVTQPFCRSCCRLRLTALGELRNCLFASGGWDLRGLVRRGVSDQQIAELFRRAVEAKLPAPHASPADCQTSLLMCQIGG